ncbi:hypothetical protein [Streptomyces sp. NPDC029004]|uniref:hypothetical protein n=1 Tax=Streptomyces sp. NPDC029004 TaxID=3154490 RepID=UPI0033D6EC8C
MDILVIIWIIAGLVAAVFCVVKAVQAESGSGQRVAWVVAIPFAYFAGIFLAALACVGFILWFIFEAISGNW